MQFGIGFLLALFSLVAIGSGDFFAGLTSKKVEEKSAFVAVAGVQTVLSILTVLFFSPVIVVHTGLLSKIIFGAVIAAVGQFLFYKA